MKQRDFRATTFDIAKLKEGKRKIQYCNHNIGKIIDWMAP